MCFFRPYAFLRPLRSSLRKQQPFLNIALEMQPWKNDHLKPKATCFATMLPAFSLFLQRGKCLLHDYYLFGFANPIFPMRRQWCFVNKPIKHEEEMEWGGNALFFTVRVSLRDNMALVHLVISCSFSLFSTGMEPLWLKRQLAEMRIWLLNCLYDS